MAKKTKQPGGPGVRITNRKARHDFHILEVLECGIELTGTEVKSIRAGQVGLAEAYARLDKGELYLVGARIDPYSQAAAGMQHDPTRDRRLLVRRRQIAALETHVRQKGKTLVPLAMYFKRGWAKCQIGLAVGKRQYDKREALRKRDQQREMERAVSRRR